jgi:hypothetical protein
MVAVPQCGALNPSQLRGRSDRSATDALIKIINPIGERIDPTGKRKQKFVSKPSLITHDIMGAFNNTYPSILTSVMQK